MVSLIHTQTIENLLFVSDSSSDSGSDIDKTVEAQAVSKTVQCIV